MKDRKQIASLLIFLGTTLCFFLPFMTVSCGGIEVFTLSGQQLATGTTLTQPQPFGPPQTQRLDADPFAAIAGVCAILGIVLSLIGRKMASMSAIASGVGVTSLFIMRSRLDAEIQKQSQGIASVNYESGFTAVVLLFLTAAAWNIYLILQRGRIREAEDLGGAGELSVTGAEIASRASPNKT